VQQRALADLHRVEGNPLENIDPITDPAKNFKIIMKGGTIYKNMLTVRTC
jgi:imidazolonepropionase-like amidohydrolase